jgi:hypothetical protein
MKLLKVIFFLIPFLAFGQYQNSPNKAVLGNQTTGKGLIYYGSGAPAYTPTTNKNAYHYVDTTTDVFWHWDFTSMLWDTVTVSGGGGGGTDSQAIDTFTYASDTLRLSMSGDGQMYKYVVIPGSSDDQNIDTFSIVSDTIRLSLQSDGQKYKYVNLLPYKDNTDSQTIYWNSATGNLTIYGGNTVSLDGRYLTTEADGSITNELQTIDTFSISSNTVRLSLSSDGQAYKTIDLSPYLDNTDSQTIDTLSFSSDTLRVSLSGDGQKYKSVYLPADTDDQSLSYGTKTGNTIPLNITGGSGVNLDQGTNIEITRDASNYITFKGNTTIDTFSYGSDTIKISLTNDGQATKKIYVPQIADTDDQTLSRSFDTIFISQGNYIILPVDINTDNQAFDTAQISSDTLRLSLEGDLVPVYKFNLKPYLDNTDSQTIDTFEINSNTLRLSASGDGQAYKTVSLSPYLDNTDAQVIDTFSYSSDTIRLSVSGDGQKYKTIYIPPGAADDNQTLSITAGKGTISIESGNSIQLEDSSATNELQTIDTMDVYGGVYLRTSLSGDGQAAKLVDLTNFYNLLTVQNKSGNTIPLRSSTVTTDLSVTEGDNITLTKNGTYQFTIDSRPTIDTFSYSSDTLRVSVYGDQQKYKTVYIPQGADDQFIDTLSIVSNNLRLSLDGDGRAYSSVSLSPYLDNTDSQTLSITAGKGTISISGGNSIQLGDSSATNEIQTIDTFSISSNTLRASLSSDGQAFKTVDLSPYLDNTDSQVIDTFSFSSDTLRVSISGDGQKYKTVYIPGVTDTDDQNLSFATKSGSTNILNISDGAGVNILDGTGINISRDASNQITVNNTGDLSTTNEIQTVDTFEINSNNLRLSLLNDGQLYKTVSLSPYLDNTDAQQIDTFNYSLDTLRLSVTGDGQKYKTIYLPNITDTDDQYIDTFRVNSGNVELSLNGDGRAVSTVAITSIAPVQAVSAGTGISVSGTSTITVTNTGDLSNTNEIQTIDTFEINSNTLRASLSGDGQAFKTVSLSPYLDNTDNQVVDTFSYSSDTLRLSVSGDGQKYKTIYLPNITDTDDQTIDTFQLSGNTLRLSLQADGQAYKTVDLSKYVDTTFAQNGTRISNDSLYWGSQSSSTDNGSTLIHDTYIWQGGNDITFFNNGDGPDKPTLYLSAVNDVWIGANSTSTAGTAGTAGKPSVYLRYGSSGAYSFGGKQRIES